MTKTYESLAEFAQSAGTVYFFLLFIGTLVYALWPKNSARAAAPRALSRKLFCPCRRHRFGKDLPFPSN